MQPAVIYWLPLEHSCGCLIDWGYDDRFREELAQRMLVLAAYPCPMHGSATGVPAPSLGKDEERELLWNEGLFYRAAREEHRSNGQRNRAVSAALMAKGIETP
jgi:hypothetical protein